MEGDTKRSRNFSTKEERDQFLADMDDGYDPDAGRQLFSAFAVRWAEPQDWADDSRQSWDECFKRLDRHIGDMPLERIDNLTFRGLQKKLADEDGYARKTVILTMSQAKSVMKSAYAVGAIKRDPTLGLKAPKVRMTMMRTTRRSVLTTCPVGPRCSPSRCRSTTVSRCHRLGCERSADW